MHLENVYEKGTFIECATSAAHRLFTFLMIGWQYVHVTGTLGSLAYNDMMHVVVLDAIWWKHVFFLKKKVAEFDNFFLQQVGKKININTVDFQKIVDTNLRTALKNVNIVTNG